MDDMGSIKTWWNQQRKIDRKVVVVFRTKRTKRKKRKR